jgi:hypothetical protein
MSSDDAAIEQAGALMLAFSERTGVAASRPGRRYLWTDAFAVCNFLELARRTRDARYRDLALRLVDRVHHVLGRHRADDARQGWLSGLGEVEGELHPTRGGLRIGKPLPERAPAEPFDERLEWERDGQYFHYLTQWMHALDQVARATRDPRCNAWGRELAASAHAAFRRVVDGTVRGLWWKMSTDLSRPLVWSMGQHDPLSGFVACIGLDATAAELGTAGAEPDLRAARADFAALLENGELRTPDPLGLGGLLADACRVAFLTGRGALDGERLLERLLRAALGGLALYLRQGDWRAPAARRLAFRELGLAIGLSAVGYLREEVERHDTGGARVRASLQALERGAALGPELVASWRAERSGTDEPSDHRDIDDVMLATALLPEGYVLPALLGS